MTFPIVQTLKDGFDAIVSALGSSATNVNVSHNGGVVWSGILPASGEWVSIVDGVELAYIRSLGKANGVYTETFYTHSPTFPYVTETYYRIELIGDTIKARATNSYDVDLTLWIQMYPSGGIVGGIVGPIGPTGLLDIGAWQNPTFAANWSNLGSGYQNVQFRLAGDMVQIRGVSTCSVAWASNQTIMTLPVGYRNANRTIHAVEGSSAEKVRVDILGTGEVRFVSSTPGTTTTGVVSLNIQFYTS